MTPTPEEYEAKFDWQSYFDMPDDTYKKWKFYNNSILWLQIALVLVVTAIALILIHS